MRRICTDFTTPSTANTQVVIDVRDHPLADGVSLTYRNTLALPNGFLPDRHYVLWGGITSAGYDICEWRLYDNNVPPPDWPHREIISFVRTRLGPEFLLGNNTDGSGPTPNPHYQQPCIWRWFSQWDDHVRYYGHYIIATNIPYLPHDPLNPTDVYRAGPTGVFLRPVRLKPDPTEAADGAAFVVPVDACAMLEGRLGISMLDSYKTTIQNNYTGFIRTGGDGRIVVQGSLGQWPSGPSWMKNKHNAFRINAQGIAGFFSPGDVFDKEGFFPLVPGEGWLGLGLTDTTHANVVGIIGCRLSSHFLAGPFASL